MGYFDKILESRNLETCPLPLWKLKITDDEYRELRRVLGACTDNPENDDIFGNFNKECTLFYAEYWRREYQGSVHSIANVYNCLYGLNDHRRNNNEFIRLFHHSAIIGARRLGIRFYVNPHNRHEYLDSMLYQGGLPMNLVTAVRRSNAWDYFTCRLVNHHINFDELNLGNVAIETDSIREFCEEIINGIDHNDYTLMPFYCMNGENSWFVYLINLAQQERRRRNRQQPFSFAWEFEFDQNRNLLKVKYVVKGIQSLPLEFVTEQGLERSRFFTTQVRLNGLVIDSFDYIDFYCRYPVMSRHSYNDGDNVSFFINDVAYLSKYLDMSVPHIMYRHTDAHHLFLLGNKLGRKDSAIVFPKSWSLEGDEIAIITTYWHNVEYNVAFIPQGFVDTIYLTDGDNERLSFSPNTNLMWTEFYGTSLLGNVSEQLYDARSLYYFICSDTDEQIQRQRVGYNDMVFKREGTREWKHTAPYGRIFARAQDSNGQQFVTPIRFINIGEEGDLNITNEIENENTCILQVKWRHGDVTCDTGENYEDNPHKWVVTKESCINRNIQFTLTPYGEQSPPFTIHVRAPFRGVYIWDLDGNLLQNNSLVPYVDVDRYQYQFIGDGINYSYGNVTRSLRELNGRLCIVENDNNLRDIPVNGCLTTLFDSRDTLLAMLDKTAEDMLNASVNITFFTNPHEILLSFTVKYSPYRVDLNRQRNQILIKANNRIINYRNPLNLLRLYSAECESFILEFDTDNGFIVPEDVALWGKILVVGRTNGRICPRLIDLTQELTHDDRIRIREDSILQIRQEINISTLGDTFWTRVLGLYRCIEQYDIPASSLLEFKCISEDPVALLCLTFQLYVQCGDEVDQNTLRNQLKKFSTDLAFQWFWMRGYIQNVIYHINEGNRIGNPLNNMFYKTMVIQWAMQQENPMQYLTNMNEDFFIPALINRITHYQEWMKSLLVDSLLDNYNNHIIDYVDQLANDIIENHPLYYVEDQQEYYVDINQNNEQIENFFIQHTDPPRGRFTEAELWLHRRVSVVAAHMTGAIDLFNLPPEYINIHDGIRRSLIFCLKSCNRKFIIELNNRLYEIS